MKKLVILITLTLLANPIFSQNKIAKQYNKKNYDKCLKLCNKHIKKRTALKQTAYLYKSLLLAKEYNKQQQALSYLYSLRATKNFGGFYKENKALFHETRNSLLAFLDSANSTKKNISFIKRLAKLYLYKFKFTENEGTAIYKTQSTKTSKKAEYLKYRVLLEYVKELNSDIPTKKNLKTKEIFLLSSILFVAKPIDNFKAVYNEIYTYLQNNNKLTSILDNLCLKYAKKADFTYRTIGNPATIKKTINYQKVKERVQNSSAENENTIEKLSKYLTSNFNEAEKVYAIYHWVDTNLKYKNDSTSEAGVNKVYQMSEYGNKMVRKSQSAKVVLQNKSAVCEGYASLFNALCFSAGISSEHVSGYAAGTSYIIGYHGWNIVEINNRWYLIDPTWGDEKYFLANPLMFNKKHHATSNKQLLFAPYSEKYFLTKAKEYAQRQKSIKKDSISTFKLAFVYYESGEYKKAIKAFKKFGETYQKAFDYYYYLGLSYSSLSDKENAIVQMNKALEIKPDNIAVLLKISSLYRLQYNYTQAYKYLNRAKKVDPFKNSIHRSEIYLLHKMKEYHKALKIADSLVINQAKDIGNLVVRAYLYTNNNRFKKGIADCEAILLKDNANSDALGYMAECWQGLKDYEKALFYIAKQEKINPDDYDFLFRKAFLLFLTKSYEDAYEIALKMKEIKPLSPYSWGNLAWYSILTKRYDEAISYAKTSIAINKTTEVWNSLALAYIYTNQYTKAEKIYTEYKDKKYQISASYKTYGDFFTKWINYLSDNDMHHKDFEKALKLLNKNN